MTNKNSKQSVSKNKKAIIKIKKKDSIPVDNKEIKSDAVKVIKYEMFRDSFRLFDVIAISIITLILGLFVGSSFFRADKINKTGTDDKNLTEFLNTLSTIKDRAYNNVSDDELFSAAISGMLNALGDDYASYFSTSEATNFDIRMTGSYIGAGCEIALTVDNEIAVLTVYPDTPASEAGLQYGDIIIEADGKSINGWSTDELSSYIRTGGDIGTKIALKVRRGEQELIIPIVRKYVTLSSVSSEIINRDNRKIGYIKVSLFALNTYNQFENALLDLEKQGIESLIIDVRDNTGGYLSIATSMVSLFLPKDKVIYQLESKDKTESIYSMTDTARKYKIAVLINENSASASEILAASLKESYGAILIGKTTYGKGSVQETNTLSDGSMIKYTIQRWLTPNGTCVDGIGYNPDMVVEDTNEVINTAINKLME